MTCIIQLIFSSFDAASLAILEKLSTIEELLNNSNQPHSSPPIASDVGVHSPSSMAKSIGAPKLERSQGVACFHLSVERVLAWPIFVEQNPYLDLPGLLNATGETHMYPVSAAADLEHPRDAHQLIQRFMDHVFIFNPVVEEATVNEYMEYARVNGFGWHAPSCLLVSSLVLELPSQY